MNTALKILQTLEVACRGEGNEVLINNLIEKLKTEISKMEYKTNYDIPHYGTNPKPYIESVK